ncbi:TetR/AcrR family transcriptional regulator [Gordonia lacunae]|uniref:HTH tetR-type domain-containing protein n=1 Tax=Gordonia lacunae TaxID=417102 RepID=A0A243Q5Q3_9ACTN|nr:TetR/AcrR family transcriptional regulator [Gordonia lacunae]OUC75745.1 hypothetical protein CA982_25095 [Gordonia lacunae]
MVPTTRAASPRRRRTTSEQQILAATMGLLHTGQRLPDIPVHDIIASAGVSRSTFYQHFPGKTDLAFRIARPAMDAARATADQWWANSDWGTQEDMINIVRALMAQGREHRLAWLALFDTADRDPEAAALVEGLVLDYVAQMAQRIVREQNVGDWHRSHATQLARLILITTRACILDQLSHHDSTTDETFSVTLGRVLGQAVGLSAPDS